MKKIIIMLVIALFVVIFAGCNATAKNPGLDSEANSNTLLGRAAGEAAGLDMDNPPTWEEIQEMRKSSDCPVECFWAYKGVLRTKVNGETTDLTPDEALQRYGDNPEFVKEYIFLMSYNFPPATIVDKDGDLQNLSYDPPGEEWEGPSD